MPQLTYHAATNAPGDHNPFYSLPGDSRTIWPPTPESPHNYEIVNESDGTLLGTFPTLEAAATYLATHPCTPNTAPY